MNEKAKRTGTLEPVADASGQTYYRGKIRLKDGTKKRIEIPEGKRRDEKLARAFLAKAQREEDRTGQFYKIKQEAMQRASAATTGAEGESLATWFDRYFKWRAAKPKGGESVDDSRGRVKKWVLPCVDTAGRRLGDRPIRSIARDDLEALVAFLDEQVKAGALAWKTAGNIWGEVTAGFNVATKGKDKSLRVLDANPCDSVAGPDKGVEKRKPFLRPDEVIALLGCCTVPIERRRVYAVAIYTAMRQGELRALRVGDVDLDAMQIVVARTRKGKVEKERTKTKRARVVNIEPNLAPLLRLLVEGRAPDERVLDVRAHNRCASNLRADLLEAGISRAALHVETELTAHLTFHNLRDTCLTHMAVRRDPPQDVQWRAGHTTPAMTEQYIANARYEAGANFGKPLPELPAAVLRTTPRATEQLGAREDGGGAGNRTPKTGDRARSRHNPRNTRSGRFLGTS